MSAAPTVGSPAQSRASFGTWLTQPSQITTELFARSGMDWVVIDLQHSSFDFRTAVQAIQLLDVLGIEMFVRLPAAEIAMLPRMLDHGLAGAIIANIDGPEQVAHCIANARYQPDGIRSVGGQRFGLRPTPSRIREVRPKIYVIIETAAATATLEQIAALPELAGLVLGPGDLAMSLGLEMDQAPASQRWHEIMDQVLATAIARGIEGWAWASDGIEAATWAAKGWHRVSVGSDVALLRVALSTELARARGQSPEAAAVTTGIGGYGTTERKP